MILRRIFKRRTSKDSPDNNALARIDITIHNDTVELSMCGDEIRIGGALVTIMLRSPYFYHIFNNAVVAAEMEINHRRTHSAYQQLMTINPN